MPLPAAFSGGDMSLSQLLVQEQQGAAISDAATS